MEKDRPLFQDRIVANPDILVGKPIVRGTRIPVYIVLAHLAHNFDLNELFASYPRLTIEDVQACLAYAGAVIDGDVAFPTLPTRVEDVAHARHL